VCNVNVRMAPPIARHLTDEQLGMSLAFIGGYIDCVGYLGLFGLFTASITGNLVVAAAAITLKQSVVSRLVVSAVFVGAAGFAAAVTMCMRRSTCCTRRVGGASTQMLAAMLMGFELVSLLALWGVGVGLTPALAGVDSYSDSPSVLALGSIAAFGMGLQAGMVKEAFPSFPPTTVMTSTLVNNGVTAVNTIILGLAAAGVVPMPPKPVGQASASSEAARAELRAQFAASCTALAKLFKPLFIFCAGAALGALTFFYGKWHSVAIPAVLLALLLAELVHSDGKGAEVVASAAPAAATAPRAESKEEAKEEAKEASAESSSGSNMSLSLLRVPPV
jgi:uncharacterized membrane protein YoaK (UPF0700 family)